ncbi:MAG TPA: hypothetical protein DCX54_07405 [Flavobacteriales bacterium]|nr:hypothetical protein [Flavobacteriales bacterium]
MAIPLIESCRETQSPYELEGTLWYNEFYGETDSMRFLENNVAEYFLAEKAWWAPSTYIPKDDTLYLLTQRKAYIPENLEAPDPEIVQKLIFHNDTMTMVYQAIYRGENISVSKPVDFHFIKVKDDWWSLLWKDE